MRKEREESAVPSRRFQGQFERGEFEVFLDQSQALCSEMAAREKLLKIDVSLYTLHVRKAYGKVDQAAG
jgi:hypothetical protein